jgi:hypothetical protein
LIVGDVLQNLRNALDNLVYGMAEACASKAITEEEAARIAFPIYGPKVLSGARADEMMLYGPASVIRGSG